VRRLALSLALVAAPAVADPLDGRAFDVAITYANGHLRRHAHLVFRGGWLETPPTEGTTRARLRVRASHGTIVFDASARAGAGERRTDVTWTGVVRGDAIEGTLTIVHKDLGSHLVYRGRAAADHSQ
jgi:hypothetical protein